MLFGLSIQEIVVLASVVIGIVLLTGSLILLFKEKRVIDPANRDQIAIELPLLGKFKANFPAAFALIIGAGLVGYPLWKTLESPDMLFVSGKIQLHQGKTVTTMSGIVISIFPSSQSTLTLADGSYSINVPKSGKGVTYQALLHLPNSKPPLFHLDVVKFTPEGQGNVDHTFDWSGK